MAYLIVCYISFSSLKDTISMLDIVTYVYNYPYLAPVMLILLMSTGKTLYLLSINDKPTYPTLFMLPQKIILFIKGFRENISKKPFYTIFRVIGAFVFIILSYILVMILRTYVLSCFFPSTSAELYHPIYLLILFSLWYPSCCIFYIIAQLGRSLDSNSNINFSFSKINSFITKENLALRVVIGWGLRYLHILDMVIEITNKNLSGSNAKFNILSENDTFKTVIPHSDPNWADDPDTPNVYKHFRVGEALNKFVNAHDIQYDGSHDYISN